MEFTYIIIGKGNVLEFFMRSHMYLTISDRPRLYLGTMKSSGNKSLKKCVGKFIFEGQYTHFGKFAILNYRHNMCHQLKL